MCMTDVYAEIRRTSNFSSHHVNSRVELRNHGYRCKIKKTLWNNERKIFFKFKTTKNTYLDTREYVCYLGDTGINKGRKLIFMDWLDIGIVYIISEGPGTFVFLNTCVFCSCCPLFFFFLILRQVSCSTSWP